MVFSKVVIACAFVFSGNLLASSESSNIPATQSPNFIVIMADDLGYSDVGFNGGKQIPTPHIDSIAENGVHFSNAYTSYPVCGPSRAGFMTGRYQQRFVFFFGTSGGGIIIFLSC